MRSLPFLRPAWKEEGYCDYVVRDSSFDPVTGRALLAAGETDASPCFAYFTYREMVTYLIDRQHYDFERLMSARLDEPEVRQETTTWLRERRKPR